MESTINFSYYIQLLRSVIPWLATTIVCLVVVVAILRLAVRLLRWRYQTKQSFVYLELTPPAFTDRTPHANKQLFAVLHGFANRRSWLQKLKQSNNFSLEITSTREQGIRFVMRVPENEVAMFEHTINAYLPEVKVLLVEDYLPTQLDVKKTRIISFRQCEHFAYPLQNYGSLEEHDPVGYITGVMTKLEPGELIAFQLVVQPVKVREASTLSHKILSNQDLLPQLHHDHVPAFGHIVRAINKLLFMMTDTVTSVHHGSHRDSYNSSQQILQHKQQAAMKIKPARTLSIFEQELVESIHTKLAQPLYRVDIRAIVVAKDKSEMSRRFKSIEAALASYSVPKYQGFKVRDSHISWVRKYNLFMFKHRLTDFVPKHSNTLAVSEVADLYHFPHSLTAKTENVIKSLSKTLPAPVSLKNGTELDILLGENKHHGSSTPIGLTSEERQRHIYIIGGTGNGKTTMLQYAIVQDIQNGKGVAIIDPHGDLAVTILRHIPEHRVKDVVYINPDDLSHPVGVNLLELPEGLTGDELLREKDLVTESTISVLRKIFSEDDTGGHRIEYVLRNTIQTALTVKGANLFTIFRLLNDGNYRTNIVRTLEDEDLQNFWRNEIGKAGNFQRVKMAAGITAKIGRFLFSASAKRILEQEKSTIDFDDILDSGKILICNFSKGILGEDTSTLFGTTVLAKLQVASLRRARQEQTDRHPFYLYVDEFQNFATISFVQMLSEARKYKLFLTMAEQSTSQQDQQRLVDIILANVGTVVAFRSGSPADERLILPLFSPYVEQGEIANLPAYSFYARIAAIEPHEPMSGRTVLLADDGSKDVYTHVIELSRETYGRVVKQQVVKQVKPSAASTIKKPGKKSTADKPTKNVDSP